MSGRAAILVVDDEPRAVETVARILEEEFDVHAATGVEEARAILKQEWVQAILCDQRMPDMTGVEFLGEVGEQWPEIVRMIISGYTDPEDIIDGINQAGIYQYITKPWHPDHLLLTVRNATRLYQMQRENEVLSVELRHSVRSVEDDLEEKRAKLREHFRGDDTIVRAATSPLNTVCETLRRVAPFDVAVLLTGESGTGKELCARALHYNSLRADKSFVVENCGAIPDDLLESELFGYKKGAFTGAYEDRIGLFEQANGGTIFLDEIGEVSPAFQVKLLRVLQEGEIRPLGSTRRRRVDVRVVAATNKDLESEVRARRFRRDLYYRLAGVTVELPRLRDRPQDLSLIAATLREKCMGSLGKRVGEFTDEALACLGAYGWPGNVRELENEIQRMVVFAEPGAALDARLLSPHVLRGAPPDEAPELDRLAGLDGSLKDRVEKLEERILRETLIRHGWNKSRAAEELGVSRVGLRAKLERYGLEQARN